MRRCITLIFILLGSMAGWLPGAEPYSQRLAALQSQLERDPTNKVLLFKLGDLCFDEGANDNRQAVKLADQYFAQLLRLDPTNALALAMWGSTFTMKGRDAFWPTTRLSLVKEGLKKMDAAVALAPDDFLVRFTRAVNNYHMPKIMGREEIVHADMAWLWERVLSKPASLEADVKQNVAFYQGMILNKQRRPEAAIEVWQKGIAFAPDSSRAGQMKEQLDKLHGPAKK
jgi:tetratricopeptide (TPR) repeat protein